MNILGNIRPTYIKNIALELVKTYPAQFKNDDFQHNKIKVAELTDVKSNVIRNRIAGYVTRVLSPRERKTIGGFEDEQANI